MSETISSSFYLEPYSKITEFSCEIINEVQKMVRGVQYYKNINTGEEKIVNSISQKTIFPLTGNPNVTKLEDNPDIRLAYHIRLQTPGQELSTVYVIDLDTNYVYSISHLFFTYETAEKEKKSVCILGAYPESYINIVNYLKGREDATECLMVKQGDNWISFKDIVPEFLVPAEIDQAEGQKD